MTDHHTTNINHPAEAAAVADFAKKHLAPTLLSIGTVDGKSVTVLHAPNGSEITSIKDLLDEYRTAPERRKGVARFTELESFCEHVKRFMDDDSVIFADRNPQAPSLTAVLDYHRLTATGAPRFGEHRSVYSFPVSDQWQAWIKSNDQSMAQAQFAAFLEDRIADVMDPIGAAGLESTRKAAEALMCTFASPSRLMDLSRGLTVRVDSVVANAQNLKSGESVLRFDTRHVDEAGAPLDVPGAFLVGVPIFRGGAAYSIAARLRYRIKDGKVTWSYSLYRLVEAYDDAFRLACKAAADATTLPVLFGSPEA